MRKDLYTNGSVDLPTISKKRSYFDLTHSSHIDMNIGMLYPIDQFIDLVPGDTFEYAHKAHLRMTNPPKTPTMDQLVFDIYFFYVPNRIVWDDWDKFISNNSGNDFYTGYTNTEPVVDLAGKTPSSSYAKLDHSVLDYLGFGSSEVIGSTIGSLNPSALPVRGYYKIWNEYFRYESLQHPILVSTGNTPIGSLMSSSGNYYTNTTVNKQYPTWSSYHNTECYGLNLMPVNRLPGYFSRALPQPLAGDDVKILQEISILSPEAFLGTDHSIGYSLYANNGNVGISAGSGTINWLDGNLGTSDSNSIRALSQAFALNKFLYIDNVYGKRITEWTYGHFGVNVPDSRVQRPEFLAKKRIYVNINQIMQSSETGTSPQGNAGAWSETYDVGKDFVKSFVEYGNLFALGCIRVLNHSFAQGIDRKWSRRTRFDYYLPEFNNVGDQEIKTKEIYCNTTYPDQTWGYQERYAEYKMIPSRVAGYMRPQVTGTLALWTYTDYYSTAPTFNIGWMFEPHGNFNDTIYIDDSTAPSFILDYVAEIKGYRSMPYHNEPGDLNGSW